MLEPADDRDLAGEAGDGIVGLVQVAGVDCLEGDETRHQLVAGLEDDAVAAAADAIGDHILADAEVGGAGFELANLKAGEEALILQALDQRLFLAACGDLAGGELVGFEQLTVNEPLQEPSLGGGHHV